MEYFTNITSIDGVIDAQVVGNSTQNPVNNTNKSSEDHCGFTGYYYEVLPYKTLLVCTIGLAVSLISTIQNSMLLYIFAFKSNFRHTHLFYMSVLSLFDITLAFCYPFLTIIQMLAFYYDSVALSAAFYGYLRPFYVTSNVSTTCCTFLIVAATIERYLMSNKGGEAKNSKISIRRRGLIATTAVLASVFFKGSMYFEVATGEDLSCNNSNRYWAGASTIASDDTYRLVWMFYVRNIATVFLPFFLLAFLNVAIVLRLRNADPTPHIRAAFLRQPLSGVRDAVAQRNAGIRNATRALTLIVASYLASNALNILITSWEHVSKETLASHPKFYTIASDLITIFTMMGGALRLEIFGSCNESIRKEVINLLKNIRQICLRPILRRKRIDQNNEEELVALNPMI